MIVYTMNLQLSYHHTKYLLWEYARNINKNQDCPLFAMLRILPNVITTKSSYFLWSTVSVAQPCLVSLANRAPLTSSLLGEQYHWPNPRTTAKHRIPPPDWTSIPYAYLRSLLYSYSTFNGSRYRFRYPLRLHFPSRLNPQYDIYPPDSHGYASDCNRGRTWYYLAKMENVHTVTTDSSKISSDHSLSRGYTGYVIVVISNW